MFKKYSAEQTRQLWKEQASLTQFKTALNEGGQIIGQIVKTPNNTAYAIIRENANYFIKQSKELKEAYTIHDFKYIGSLDKRLEKHTSYNSAKKRMEGLLFQIKEDFKYQDIIKEMQDDEELLNDFENVDADGNVPSDSVPAEAPVDAAPAPEQHIETPGEQTSPAAPEATPEAGSTPPMATDEPAAQPEGGDAPVDTTTTEPTGDSAEAPSEDDSSKEDSTDIQSLLGKLQNEIQKLDNISPSQTKNILNTIISSTKDGISDLDDEEKEKLANRIERDGHKIEENQVETSQGWDKTNIAEFLGEIGQEKYKFETQDSGICKGDFGLIKFDTNGESLYLHFNSSDDANTAFRTFKDNAGGVVDFNLQGNTVEITHGSLDEHSIEEVPTDAEETDALPPVGDETPGEEISATTDGGEQPTPEDQPTGGTKIDLLQSMIKAKLAQKKKSEPEISTDDNEPSEDEDPLGLIKELVTESINSYKREKVKGFIQESIDKNKEKKSFIKESIMKMFETGINLVHEDQYSDAVKLATEFVEDPAIEEGVVGDKFKRIAKPFIMAAFLTVLGGKVSAAVEQFKKATGAEPSQTEISQGIKTYEEKSGNKAEGGNGPEPESNSDDASATPAEPSLISQDLGTYEHPGSFAIDTEKVGEGAKLTDFKKINVDQAVAKYSTGGEGKSEFKELRGPRLDNKEVLTKPFEQLDDNKDSERLEKIWRLIAQNPDGVIQDGVIKNAEGKVLANNVQLKPDGKIVFDFTFVNPDSHDYKDGKTPVKMLGGELLKPAAAGGEKEVNLVWAKLKKAGAYDLGKITDPAKFKQFKDVVEKRGFKNQPGTNYWIQGEKSFWVDADKAKKLYSQGLISFNNPNVEKDFRVSK